MPDAPDALRRRRCPVQTLNDAARLALVIALVGAAALVGAWIFQYGFGILPCPLCLQQRYAYYLIIPLAFILAIAVLRCVPRRVIVTGFAIIALAAMLNAALGIYHSGIEWGYWPGPQDCTGPLNPLGGAGNLLDELNKVKVIRCDEVQWRFLGLSLAGYNVLISLLMALLALCGIRMERR
jgi:disulfide bond formation protein DsbB